MDFGSRGKCVFALNSHNNRQIMLIQNKIFVWKRKTMAFWQKTRQNTAFWQNHGIHSIWRKSQFPWFPCFRDYLLSLDISYVFYAFYCSLILCNIGAVDTACKFINLTWTVSYWCVEWLCPERVGVNVLDDITTTADGVDTYHLVKSAGRYRYKFVGLFVILVLTALLFFRSFITLIVCHFDMLVLPTVIALAIICLRWLSGCHDLCIKCLSVIDCSLCILSAVCLSPCPKKLHCITQAKSLFFGMLVW